MGNHSIGKTIAALRKEKGWTQIELAEKLQVSDKAVSKWEQDNGMPSIEFFPKMAQLFGVSIDYLMTGQTPEKEIITMSKAELCAKNDDVGLLKGIQADHKDENKKTLMDYIVQYESIRVFVAFCEMNNRNISKFSLVDALKLCLMLDQFIEVGNSLFGFLNALLHCSGIIFLCRNILFCKEMQKYRFKLPYIFGNGSYAVKHKLLEYNISNIVDGASTSVLLIL